jgi:WD40 repeat protein
MTPTPFHVVRNHAKPVHHIVFSTDGRYLYSGDEDGNVAITDLDVRRVVAFWKAHENGVLAVGEWEGGLVRSVLPTRCAAGWRFG